MFLQAGGSPAALIAIYSLFSALWTMHIILPRAPGRQRAIATLPLLASAVLVPRVLFPPAVVFKKQNSQEAIALMLATLLLGVNAVKVTHTHTKRIQTQAPTDVDAATAASVR